MTTKANIAFVLYLGATAALGGLLFGFDIAIITGAGPFLKEHFRMDDLSLGWAFSSLLFGCAIGCVAAGRLTETYGHRGILLWVALLFILTSLGTGLAPSFFWFTVARFLGGIAVGGASILAPMYVAEVSPPSMRGRMGALYQMSIVIGILIPYIINYQLHDLGDWNWRWMFLSGTIPSLIFFLLLLPAPETPRYLFRVGREKEAYFILEAAPGHFQGGVVLGLLLAYIAFFAACIGPFFWTLVPEIFPNRVRGDERAGADAVDRQCGDGFVFFRRLQSDRHRSDFCLPCRHGVAPGDIHMAVRSGNQRPDAGGNRDFVGKAHRQITAEIQ